MTVDPRADSAAVPHIPVHLLARLARGWRLARNSGQSARQRLHSILAPRGLAMLAPAFESLMSLSEVALSRRLQVGGQGVFSDDEYMLGVMVNDEFVPSTLRSDQGVRFAPLFCAIRSIRLLLLIAAWEAKEGMLDPVRRAVSPSSRAEGMRL